MMTRVRSVSAASTARGSRLHDDRIDVGEHRRAAGMDDDVRRCTERQRRGDDFVAGLDAAGEQRQMQRRGARIDRERVRRADVAGKCRSNDATRGPVVSQPDSSVATTSAISRGPRLGGANGTMDEAVVDIPLHARLCNVNT